MCRKKVSNDIFTPRFKAKIGQKVRRGAELVIFIKQNGKEDTISVSELAEALYGKGTQCLIIPPKNGES